MSEMKNLKLDTLAAAMAGIAAAGAMTTVAPGTALAAEGKGSVKCFGIQEKGQNGCAVSPKQIEAANKHFENKYGQSKPISCHGNATAAASEGFLAWVGVDTEEACFGKNGFLIKGSKVVAGGSAEGMHHEKEGDHHAKETDHHEKKVKKKADH